MANSKLEIIVKLKLKRTGLDMSSPDGSWHAFTIIEKPYQYSCLYTKVIKKVNVSWPVMVRPGRQRWTRACFANPLEAMIYGMKLAERYGKIYG